MKEIFCVIIFTHIKHIKHLFSIPKKKKGKKMPACQILGLELNYYCYGINSL